MKLLNEIKSIQLTLYKHVDQVRQIEFDVFFRIVIRFVLIQQHI